MATTGALSPVATSGAPAAPGAAAAPCGARGGSSHRGLWADAAASQRCRGPAWNAMATEGISVDQGGNCWEILVEAVADGWEKAGDSGFLLRKSMAQWETSSEELCYNLNYAGINGKLCWGINPRITRQFEVF